MRKISYFLALTLLASQAWATYIVILKNGTRYKAKDRWTMSGGKAILQLESGTTLQLDPNLIDVAKSEEATRLGYGDAKVLATPQAGTQPAGRGPQPSLGELTRLRRQQEAQQATAAAGSVTQRTSTLATNYAGPGALSTNVMSKFSGAYENIGFYDSKIAPSGPYTLRVQLTTDNEDQVFKAISATAYVMLRIPGLTNQRIDIVELFMGTATGAAAGRFQMTTEDATALDQKKMTLESYFLRRVIF